MGLIIPVRGAMYHAFSVIDHPSSADVARLYAERFGPLDQLEAELAAGPPILPPIAAATARRNLRSLLDLPADAALCLVCWLDGYREHSESNDRTHYFTPLGGIA